MASIEAALRIEPLRADDAATALPLSVEAGWNQTENDWRFMLTQGHGIGLRAVDRWVASALALPLGADLSWISMVLVAKAHRRNSYGTQLLRRCIDIVRASGAAAGLDATEYGRPVYLPLGFRDLYTLSRWRLPAAAFVDDDADFSIRPMRAEDMADIASYDAARSGMLRPHLLRYLFAALPHAAFVAEANGAMMGYALARPGRLAPQIGPIVADSEPVALTLLRRVRAAAGGPAIVDVPDAHAGLVGWLRENGATRERGFTRMILGDTPKGLADPARLFAIGGPELG